MLNVAVVVLGFLAQDAVDPRLVGAWELAFRNEAGEWRITFEVAPDGTYVGRTRGPAPIPEERGIFSARDGRWSVKATSGRADQGTYALDGDVLVLTGQAGPARWRRVRTPAPKASRLQPPPVPGPGMLDYLDGLDRLEEARWTDALAAFDRAIQAGPRATAYLFGRAAALLFLGRWDDFHREAAAAAEIQNTHDDLELARLLALGCLMSRQNERLFRYHPDFPRDAYDRWLRESIGRPDVPQPIAARFAASRRRFDPVAWALLHRAFERHARGEHALAERDAEAVLAHFPFNFTAMGLRAKTLLARGAWEKSRALFTQVLSYRTDLAEAYVGRATAAAHQGDGRRMTADLAFARQLDPTADAKLDVAPAPESPEKLFEVLMAGRPEAAAELRRAMHLRRLRYDETYQERQRSHQWAREAAPDDPDRLSAMGRFLRETIDPLGEQGEPMGSFRYYRAFDPRLQEIERRYAEQFFDAALRRNPDHIASLVGKAGSLARRTDWATAETLLRRALSLDPDSVDVLELMDEVQRHNASVRFWKALELRKDDEITHTRTTVTKFYNSNGAQVDEKSETSSWVVLVPPTPEELAEAAKHEEIGRRASVFAAQLRARAVEKRRGTPEGFAQQGLAALEAGQPVEAAAALEKAAAAAPGVLRYRYGLAAALRAAGRAGDANEILDGARNAEHTTAVVWLQVAWTELVMQRPAAARTALARARSRDPSDARVPAYLGLAALLEQKHGEALASLRAALALEAARMAESPGRVDWPELGLTLRLQLAAAGTLLSLDRPSEALEILRPTLAIQAGPLDLPRDLIAGQLPFAYGEGAVAPEPSFLAALLARSHAAAARALEALGRSDDAAAELARARGLAGRLFDDSLRYGAITVGPARKRPELDAYLRSLPR